MLRSLAIAISMYSRIPMPQFEWKEKDMRYAICFFPVVGIIIGIIEFLIYRLYKSFYISAELGTCLFIAVPLIITGGIHADGFIDTSDAFSSYKSKEEKLTILKDPHVGAFGIIRFATMLLLYYGFTYEAFLSCTKRQFACIFISFILARSLSGLAAVTIQNARKGGTLQSFVKDSNRNMAAGILVFQAVVLLILMLFVNWKTAIGFAVCSLFMYIYYIHKAFKQLGGITGDLEGWYLCIQEIAYMVTALIVWHISMMFI